jgi:hypothetical protein
LHFSSETDVNWIGRNWAFNCDFYASNFASQRTTSNECETLCSKTDGCTHFTWTHEGQSQGVCGMKSGEVSKADAFVTENTNNNLLCGIIGENYSV